jgi:preprotein translocase SecE subunit
MGFDVLKKGQGTLARSAAYGLGGLLVLYGAYRFFATFNRLDAVVYAADLPLVGDVTVWKVVAVVIGIVGLLGLHLVLNRPKAVDGMIDTEQELRKVSWPTLPEVWNATLVVVLVTTVLATVMYGFDLILVRLFRLVF